MKLALGEMFGEPEKIRKPRMKIDDDNPHSDRIFKFVCKTCGGRTFWFGDGNGVGVHIGHERTGKGYVNRKTSKVIAL
jgi:hypothetical protein